MEDGRYYVDLTGSIIETLAKYMNQIRDQGVVEILRRILKSVAELSD